MKLIIDIPEELKQKIDEGFTNQVITNKLWDATKNGTPIPDNATNGDVMKSVFKNYEYEKAFRRWQIYNESRGANDVCFADSWWNAKYKEDTKGVRQKENYNEDNYRDSLYGNDPCGNSRQPVTVTDKLQGN